MPEEKQHPAREQTRHIVIGRLPLPSSHPLRSHHIPHPYLPLPPFSYSPLSLTTLRSPQSASPPPHLTPHLTYVPYAHHEACIRPPSSTPIPVPVPHPPFPSTYVYSSWSWSWFLPPLLLPATACYHVTCYDATSYVLRVTAESAPTPTLRVSLLNCTKFHTTRFIFCSNCLSMVCGVLVKYLLI